MMGESHHRLGHFVGTDLFRRPSVTVVRTALEDREPPLLLRHKFSWKHLQDPADSGRLEEFNVAVRMLESDHRMDNPVAARDGFEQRRKARKICREVPAVATEKVGQVASRAVMAERPAIVDAAIGGGGGGQEKKAIFPRLTFVFRKDRHARNGRDRASSSLEKTCGRAGGDMAASACGRVSNDDIRSVSMPAPAELGEGDRADPAIGEHRQVSALASGKVCTGDQETGPSSCPVVTFVCRKGIDAENGRERARPAKTDGLAGDVGASGCAGISNHEDSRLLSMSAPADVVFGDGDQTDLAVVEHHQVSAPTSGKVCADNQETRPSSSPESSVDLTPLPRAEALEEHSPASADVGKPESSQTSPLEAYLHVPASASGDHVGADNLDSGSSSPISSDGFVPAVADNTGGSGVDLYMLGQRIAMEMDEEAIRAEVARQFGADRQRRAARRRAPVVAPPPPLRFSLRLSDEEAMEDVAAVSVREEVEREAPAGHGNRKRRRGG